MKPSRLKPNQKLRVKPSADSQGRTAYFVRRIPAECGRKAVNFIRFPDFAGMDGPEDDGTCQMSDYELSRLGEYAA